MSYAQQQQSKKRNGDNMLTSKPKKIQSNNLMGKQELQGMLQQLLNPIHIQLQQQTTMLQTQQQKLLDLEKKYTELLHHTSGTSSYAGTTTLSPANAN
jgi:hypothetical protein